jgi:hypothetical protein
MPRASKSDSLKTIAAERADDYMWGIPESPEFSAVQRLKTARAAETCQKKEGKSKELITNGARRKINANQCLKRPPGWSEGSQTFPSSTFRCDQPKA